MDNGTPEPATRGGEGEAQQGAGEVKRLTEELAAAHREARAQATRAEDERRGLAAEVERGAAELEAVFAAIPDGLLLCDAAGSMVRWNPAAERMLGAPPDDLRLETPEGRPFSPEEAPHRRALRGETVRGVVAVARPGEGAIWISASAAPVRTPDGRSLGAVVILTDVTTLHEQEERRDDLLRAVSHDLRTPLVIVGGYAHLLQRQLGETGASEAVLAAVQAIVDGTKRMEGIVSDLVDSARLEAGQLRFEVQPVGLGVFVAGFLARAAAALDTRRVRVDLPPDLPPVLADPNRLERVLSNLLTNALKYSPRDAEVHLEAAVSEGEVRISVRDHGPGIAPRDLPRVFDRFFRCGGAPRADGLGMGLYIARLLVEGQGGRLWAESEPGNGSTFHFTLPTA